LNYDRPYTKNKPRTRGQWQEETIFFPYHVIVFLLIIFFFLLDGFFLAGGSKRANVEVLEQVPKRSSILLGIMRHGCGNYGSILARRRSMKSTRSRECMIGEVWNIELMVRATLQSQGIVVWFLL
jgi:hypothetical protein